ncbi:uncharacterized protein LOC124999307 isoform X2 [Mugil cephalus]|uniref:uncharacterized protein LOC124999307 isoform X2 n=1 Tax=Mugil cephalus TaxID=48193 RepID=UPI001FB7034F|nr:uncharacterized protein LOC124999307 isoform X2 [Mugil cephalus]
MKTAVFLIGLVFICSEFTERTTAEDPLEGFVQSECRDRYLWIHVASGQPPRFEAIDGNEIHSISKQLASRCGYTISTFKMDGFTTFRASYYSCFTHNQNDEVFTFRFNVIVSDGDGRWTSRSVSAVCSGLIWTHREIICEEDYMEVNVDREATCGGQGGEGRQMWQEDFTQTQKTATLSWQLMFLQSDGQVVPMSISEAQRWGYSLTVSPQRVVLRSPNKQPYAEVMMVDGVPVKVVRVSLFFKQKLTVMMVNMSMACTLNPGSFDGAQLLWDIPQVVTSLVEDGAALESRSFRLGVEGVLLDEPTAASRGFTTVQQGGWIQIKVPFGAEGGYRKSQVVNNVYQEVYVIFLLYEHIFSLLYDDGSSIDTRHRMLRVLDTPPMCRQPFSLNQTIADQQVFSVYLGNIPADVILEEVLINGRRMLKKETPDQGFSITPVVHMNGSRGYELQLPFEDPAVDWTYLGGGVVQYFIDTNFSLTITPQRQSYYHHTFITARVFNAFPPEITAQCLDRGISFSVVRLPQAQNLWEVGIGHEALTSELAANRGYQLHNDSLRTTLEVPVFSVGYTYEEINLSNFYATFKVLLRDSKTLEVQTSTSKRCLFRTEDMIVCSADGTVTVVATPTSTWPKVHPDRTSLLDRTCRPKQTNGVRVLFEFQVDSCGTKAMVGEWYIVYENEILHDRLLIADGPNYISRESQFKVTMRCFYPLSSVNRLSVDSFFSSTTPGFGSVKVFQSHKDSNCSHHGSEDAVNAPNDHIHPSSATVLPQSGFRPQPKPGPSHFITVPAGHNRLISSTSPNLNHPPETQTQQVIRPVSSHITSQNVFSSSPPRYDPLPQGRVQPYNFSQSLDLAIRGETPGTSGEYSALGTDSFHRIPDAPAVGHLGSSSQTSTLHSSGISPSGLIRDRSTSSQLGVMNQNQDLQSLTADPSPSIPGWSQQHQTDQHLSLYRSSSSGVEARAMERPINQYHSETEFVKDQLMSIAASEVHHSLARTRSPERRNVQNIRVKPPRNFVPSGHLSKNPVVQYTNSQTSNPSHRATGKPPSGPPKSFLRDEVQTGSNQAGLY